MALGYLQCGFVWGFVPARMNLPDPLPETGLEPDVRRQFNKLLAYIRTLTPRESGTVAVNRTQAGFTVEVKDSARGSGGNNQPPRWG